MFVIVLVLLLAARGASAWWEAKHPLESDDRVDWKTPAEPREALGPHQRPILPRETMDSAHVFYERAENLRRP
jgi:hypothetical protein